MGIVEFTGSALILHAEFVLYGSAASETLAKEMADDVAFHWNEPGAQVFFRSVITPVQFNIKGVYAPQLVEEEVLSNTDALRNFFRIEPFANGNISFVDGVNSNTGYFKLDNLLNRSTTAAHEFGHTIGLDHPANLDIRGRGVPGIMYPRGTIVDPEFQYDPAARPLAPGGTMDPHKRKVLEEDVQALRFDKLQFTGSLATIGAFSSVWHEAHRP
ncbi:MAG: peptidase M10 [Chitinophagaceae bacterium]|nr:MAG: peptidase M10 [Chitinophagaceae bacterium]